MVFPDVHNPSIKSIFISSFPLQSPLKKEFPITIIQD